MDPFESVYKQKPPSVLQYMSGVSNVPKANHNLIVLMNILHTLKDNLVMAQNHMKQQANQYHFECLFIEGDQVFLHLQPYKQTSLKA